MASADMDTRIRGYDRGGADMTAILSCPTRSGIHLVIVTPDSIGRPFSHCHARLDRGSMPSTVLDTRIRGYDRRGRV